MFVRIYWKSYSDKFDMAILLFNLYSINQYELKWILQHRRIEKALIKFQADEKPRLEEALLLIPTNPLFISSRTENEEESFDEDDDDILSDVGEGTIDCAVGSEGIY
ncbi:unnamed protein product [Rotaria sordida]|uniref:Uncharacterized protein n=1 Tax=Rotaria sordida TaxID=392033 RepID=A0A819K7C5_9BILA|nr:unnamed protein product [Rotaria sordida]CAF3941047.1 unnamed protein product [Rotaria sordida]